MADLFSKPIALSFDGKLTLNAAGAPAKLEKIILGNGRIPSATGHFFKKRSLTDEGDYVKKLFFVNLLFQSVRSGKQVIPVGMEEPEEVERFEERHFLIRARTGKRLCRTAVRSRAKVSTFIKNVYGENVVWKYVKLLEYYEMPDGLGEGQRFICGILLRRRERPQLRW